MCGQQTTRWTTSYQRDFTQIVWCKDDVKTWDVKTWDVKTWCTREWDYQTKYHNYRERWMSNEVLKTTELNDRRFALSRRCRRPSAFQIGRRRRKTAGTRRCQSDVVILDGVDGPIERTTRPHHDVGRDDRGRVRVRGKRRRLNASSAERRRR